MIRLKGISIQIKLAPKVFKLKSFYDNQKETSEFFDQIFISLYFILYSGFDEKNYKKIF